MLELSIYETLKTKAIKFGIAETLSLAVTC